MIEILQFVCNRLCHASVSTVDQLINSTSQQRQIEWEIYPTAKIFNTFINTEPIKLCVAILSLSLSVENSLVVIVERDV